jgi:hypothetical protein
MATGPDPPTGEDGDVRQLLRELAARVSLLEIEGEHLRDSVAEEVRTRRIVVVGDDGHERIVLGAHDQYGHVTVFAASPAPGSTCVELFVTDPVDGDGAEVGLALIDAGDTVATVNVFEGRRAQLWVDDAPSRRPTEG